MSYPLAPLLKIRERRYGSALTAQSQRRKLLMFAVEHTQDAEKQFVEYSQWKEQEIERRYNSIWGQQLSISELENFFSSLTSLDLKEYELKQAWEKAKQDEEAARDAYQSVQEQVRTAHQALFKLQKQQEIWEVTQRQIAEYKADLELEDFKPKAAGNLVD